MPNQKIKIRPIKPADYPLLPDFLYHAVFQPPGATPLPREVVEKPEIAIYIKDFGGGKGDVGLVAEIDGKIIGVAWTRIIPAYGHIDDETPELAISVLPEYRSQGVGTKLMKRLFQLLAEKGFKQTSLSVQKNNPAARLYEWLGYKTVRENSEDFIMVRHLYIKIHNIGTWAGIYLGILTGGLLAALTDIGNPGMWMCAGMALGSVLGNLAFVKGKRK